MLAPSSGAQRRGATDASGELPCERLAELGDVVSVRRAAHWIELIPPGEPGQLVVRVAEAIDQEFRMASPAGTGVQVELIVSSIDFDQFAGGLALTDGSLDGDFADSVEVRTGPLIVSKQLVVAAVSLTAGQTKRLDLPPGTVRVAPLSATIGWWCDSLDAVVGAGAPIVVALFPVPVVRLELGAAAAGIVHVRVIRSWPAEAPRAAMSATTLLPFEIRDGGVHVGMICQSDDPRVRYALEIVYSDDRAAHTHGFSWAELPSVLDASAFD